MNIRRFSGSGFKNEFFLKNHPVWISRGASFVDFHKTEIGWVVGMITMKTAENKPLSSADFGFDFLFRDARF